jgi:O-acetyl-ADP-ribose deacetylase (regulator of RNase III)
LERATKIAVREVREFLQSHPQVEQVIFACFGSEALETYERVLSKK